MAACLSYEMLLSTATERHGACHQRVKSVFILPGWDNADDVHHPTSEGPRAAVTSLHMQTKTHMLPITYIERFDYRHRYTSVV